MTPFKGIGVAALLSLLALSGCEDMAHWPIVNALAYQQPPPPPPAPPPPAPPPPPPPPAAPPPTVLKTFVFKNPTSSPRTLSLKHSDPTCPAQAVLPARSETSHLLCVSSRVTFNGNPPSTPLAYIGARSCYRVGRYANPPRWALGACP